MATYYHPITGVLLNDIVVCRKSLNGAVAIDLAKHANGEADV
ncbi:hypothetical protein [Cereibacter azotoformans]|nr:hypothetical protein [Cereibacter azotoformans]